MLNLHHFDNHRFKLVHSDLTILPIKAESDDIMFNVNLKSYMHQKRIFKCSPNVSQLLPLKLGRMGKMVVIISNINITLKAENKATIYLYDDVIIVP